VISVCHLITYSPKHSDRVFKSQKNNHLVCLHRRDYRIFASNKIKAICIFVSYIFNSNVSLLLLFYESRSELFYNIIMRLSVNISLLVELCIVFFVLILILPPCKVVFGELDSIHFDGGNYVEARMQNGYLQNVNNRYF